MHWTIEKALRAIAIERDEEEYDSAFDAVRQLVEVLGENDLANRIFQDIPGEIPFELIVDLFNLLSWQTEDNGAAIARTVEQWLITGQDIRRLRIALNLDVYPFVDAQQMSRTLSVVAEKFPRLAGRCCHLIDSRQAAEEHRS